MALILTVVLSLSLVTSLTSAFQTTDVVVFTFSSNSSGRLDRFVQSAKQLNYGIKVIDTTCEAGSSSEKPAMLKNALEEFKDLDNLLVLFVDSFDALLLTTPEELTEEFKNFKAKVLFSAQARLQNASLEEYFPIVKENEMRYINPQGFIGYASDVYAMLFEAIELFGPDLSHMELSQIYFNPMRRTTLGLKLDSGSKIFQNLDGATEDVMVQFKSTTETLLYNSKLETYPAVLLGSIQTSVSFNYLANYVPNRWTSENGCPDCVKDQIDFTTLKEVDYPTVFMAIFIEYPTPFIEEFFEKIQQLSYPKFRIDLLIHKVTPMHEIEVSSFISNHSSSYRSFQIHNVSTVTTELEARLLSFKEFRAKSCDYYIAVDGFAQLEKPSILELLISRNRSFIAPMLVRPGKLWSNFWGSLDEAGFYARSEDYVELVNYNRLGLWNVPFVMNVYMIKAVHADLLAVIPADGGIDADIAICKTLRDNGVFMYLDNIVYYGHLVDGDNFETTHLHNDMYEIFNNRYTWEKKYIDDEYFNYLYNIPFEKVEQPCPDVYWMPFMSPKFCRHLIEEMEHFGKWSGGKNEDERLSGGYENVPTVDIHTNQIGWEKQWLLILHEYVKPLNAKVFQGYESAARAIMNFVVRYKPGEMDRLTPHHDASTYTINVALNRPGVDFQGGGPRFLRYNCSVTDLRVGWMLMHPGRLTHYHEGLPTTSGTRYIMVSFIDP